MIELHIRGNAMSTAGFTRRLLLVIALVVAPVGAACTALDELAGSGPEGRPAMSGDVECFKSFHAVKKSMHAAGQAKKSDHHWHHIVGQHSANIARFGARNLHCTDNLIYLTKEQHKAVSAHYQTKTPESGNKRVYEWLAEKDFRQQYMYGVNLLRRFQVRI